MKIPAHSPDTSRRGRKAGGHVTTNRPVILEWKVPEGFSDADFTGIVRRDIYGDRFPMWGIVNNILGVKVSRKPDGTYGNGKLVAALDAKLARV